MRVLAGFVITFFLVPSGVHALENAGFVNGIWFSSEPVTNYGSTEIFAIVHNEGDAQLKGIATLFVNGVAVGARDVVLSRGGIKKLTFAYEFSAGAHEVRAHFTPADGADLSSAQLGATVVRVVADTDGDGIQDTTDTDDDNDSIPDDADARPLVFDDVPEPEQELSESGLALWNRLTGERDSDIANTEQASATPSTNPVARTIRSLEDIRKRGAETFSSYEEEQRAKVATFDSGVASSTDEAHALSHSEEGKKREHQLAAAGAAWLHFVFDEEIMFYIHVLVLVLSVVHLAWGWFMKFFKNAGTKKEDEDEWDDE